MFRHSPQLYRLATASIASDGLSAPSLAAPLPRPFPSWHPHTRYSRLTAAVQQCQKHRQVLRALIRISQENWGHHGICLIWQHLAFFICKYLETF